MLERALRGQGDGAAQSGLGVARAAGPHVSVAERAPVRAVPREPSREQLELRDGARVLVQLRQAQAQLAGGLRVARMLLDLGREGLDRLFDLAHALEQHPHAVVRAGQRRVERDGAAGRR